MKPVRVPMADVPAHLQGYRAQPLREYSNNKRHVYFVPHLKQYITVRKKGELAELEFTVDCPCTYDD